MMLRCAAGLIERCKTLARFCDNMMLRGDEGYLIQDEVIAGKEEAPNRSLRAKEDEEVLIRPPPEPPPWRKCATRVWTTSSISVLLYLCFYFKPHVVLFVMYAYFCQTITLGGGDERFALATLGSFRPTTGS
ncbi:unnamed protein product, partial [Cuscuta epithymum]